MNPYWTTDGVARGFDFSYQKTDAGNTNIIRYNTKTLSGGMNFGVPLTEYHYINAGLSYESTSINTNPLFLDPIIAQFLLREGNNYNLIRFSTAFTYDTRNSAIFPERGTLQRIRGEITVPGADLTYYKVNYESKLFVPLAKNYIFMMRGEIGYGGGYGSTDQLPFFENFYAGGPRTVRGYQENSLGPQDFFRRALGGNVQVVGGAEVIIPVPFLAELKSVRLSTFMDAGNVWSVDEDIRFADVRMAAGVSGIWMSPFGLLSVSLAQPFRDRPGDRTQRFQFNFGTQF